MKRMGMKTFSANLRFVWKMTIKIACVCSEENQIQQTDKSTKEHHP